MRKTNCTRYQKIDFKKILAENNNKNSLRELKYKYETFSLLWIVEWISNYGNHDFGTPVNSFLFALPSKLKAYCQRYLEIPAQKDGI